MFFALRPFDGEPVKKGGAVPAILCAPQEDGRPDVHEQPRESVRHKGNGFGHGQSVVCLVVVNILLLLWCLFSARWQLRAAVGCQEAVFCAIAAPCGVIHKVWWATVSRIFAAAGVALGDDLLLDFSWRLVGCMFELMGVPEEPSLDIICAASGV